MKNSFLIVDATSDLRRNELKSRIKEAHPDCSIYEYVIIRKEGKALYELQLSDRQNRLLPAAPPENGFTVRLRHFADWNAPEKYRLLPDAVLKIAYGANGFYDDRLHSDEAAFYAPLHLADINNLQSNFRVADVRELTAYALGQSGTYPGCLLPRGFDQEEEERLKNEHKKSKPSAGGAPNWESKSFSEPTKKAAVIWNDIGEDVTPLYGRYSRLFRRKADTLVRSREDFERMKLNIREYDCVLLCLELAWSSHFLMSYEGIDVLAELRQAGFKGVVFITSFSPWMRFQSMLDEDKTHRLKILQTPYLFFIDAANDNMTPAHLENYRHLLRPGMSNQMLRDIRYYILDRAGNLHDEFHDFRGLVRETLGEDPETTAVVEMTDQFFREKIKPLVAPGNILELERIREEIASGIRMHPEQNPFEHMLLPAFNRIRLLLPDQVPESGEPRIITDWAVLFLDDRADERERIRNILEGSGLICHTAASGFEAIEILKKDARKDWTDEKGHKKPGNFFTVLISDFRLLQEDGSWQQMQGYDVVEYACRQLPNFLACCILTDKQGAILREVRKPSGIRLNWFSKSLTTEERGAKEFAAEIREIGLDTHDALIAQKEKGTDIRPAPAWVDGIGFNPETRAEERNNCKTVPLKEWYRYYRSLDNYEHLEGRINQLATAYIELYDRDKKQPNNTADNSALKNAIKSNFDVRLQYRASLKVTPQEDPNELPTFLNRLLGRRVVWYLVKKRRETDLEVIGQLLTFNPDKGKDPHMFSTFMALASSVDEIKKTPILIEEQQFLDSI